MQQYNATIQCNTHARTHAQPTFQQTIASIADPCTKLLLCRKNVLGPDSLFLALLLILPLLSFILPFDILWHPNMGHTHFLEFDLLFWLSISYCAYDDWHTCNDILMLYGVYAATSTTTTTNYTTREHGLEQGLGGGIKRRQGNWLGGGKREECLMPTWGPQGHHYWMRCWWWWWRWWWCRVPRGWVWWWCGRLSFSHSDSVVTTTNLVIYHILWRKPKTLKRASIQKNVIFPTVRIDCV